MFVAGNWNLNEIDFSLIFSTPEKDCKLDVSVSRIIPSSLSPVFQY